MGSEEGQRQRWVGGFNPTSLRVEGEVPGAACVPNPKPHHASFEKRTKPRNSRTCMDSFDPQARQERAQMMQLWMEDAKLFKQESTMAQAERRRLQKIHDKVHERAKAARSSLKTSLDEHALPCTLTFLPDLQECARRRYSLRYQEQAISLISEGFAMGVAGKTVPCAQRASALKLSSWLAPFLI